MSISFLKRLFLQGITFSAVLNLTVFNSFMAVNSLSDEMTSLLYDPFLVYFVKETN